MSQETDNKNKKQQKSLQPYHSPHLVIFGALRDLTAAGTGNLRESGSGGGGQGGGGGPQPPPGHGGTPPGQDPYPPNDPQYRRP